MFIFLGAVLLLIPFLLIFCFTDRFQGFLYILTAVTALHLFIALITQLFHVFFYLIILEIHLTAALATVFILIRKTPKISFKIRINWLTLLAFGIIIFELWSVHYFYSGALDANTSQQTVARASYPYPYFSDEWVGVSLTNYSLTHNSLPTVNPLMGSGSDRSFPNIFIGFFAVISELFLLLSLSPLTGYPLFSLASGVIICWLIYILLKKNGLGSFSAILGALSITYIVNGQNLPGIWYLLPFIGGTILFLLNLTTFNSQNRWLTWASGLLALLLYPPLIVFIVPTFLADLFFHQQLKISTKLKMAVYGFLATAVVASLIIILQKYKFGNISNLITSYLIYPALDKGIPSFAVWNVLPMIVLPFAILGLVEIWKKKLFFLIAPLLTGLLFWIIYSYSLYSFIIGYNRIVAITSFIIIITASFGWAGLIEKITKNFPALSRPKFRLGIKIFILVLFCLLALSYTKQSAWAKLTLKIQTPNGEQLVNPLAPATQFLTTEDLQIFKSVSKKKFLSSSWKGLVIGAATGNYPLDTKSSIITNHILNFNLFMSKNCDIKNNLARQYNLKYVYAPEFQCPNFLGLTTSTEGLHLYKFNP